MRFKSLRSFDCLDFCLKVDDDWLIVNYVYHLSIWLMNDLSFRDVLYILIKVEEILIELLGRWENEFFAWTHMLVPMSMTFPSRVIGVYRLLFVVLRSFLLELNLSLCRS